MFICVINNQYKIYLFWHYYREGKNNKSKIEIDNIELTIVNIGSGDKEKLFCSEFKMVSCPVI